MGPFLTIHLPPKYLYFSWCISNYELEERIVKVVFWMKIVMLPHRTYNGIFYLLEIEPAYLLQDAILALEICFISILLFNNTIQVILVLRTRIPMIAMRIKSRIGCYLFINQSADWLTADLSNDSGHHLTHLDLHRPQLYNLHATISSNVLSPPLEYWKGILYFTKSVGKVISS